MLDIRALCREHGIPLIEGGHHHTHQGWLQIHCPFCTDGRHGWHMGFSLERGNFNCWRCGSHRTIDVLERLLGNRQAARNALDRRTEEAPPIRKIEPRRRTLEEPPNLKPLRAQHKKYLRRRGFDPEELVDEWQLRGTNHLGGDWRWRIVFPIYDRDGRAVAYCGRAISDEARPKYKMSTNEQILTDPRSLLYGIHHVPGDTVVIVEGPADVWRLGPGAVATLGIDWKEEQAFQLKEFPRQVVMFDPDVEAQHRARDLAEWLSMYSGETELIQLLKNDPGDMSTVEAKKIMDDLVKSS